MTLGGRLDEKINEAVKASFSTAYFLHEAGTVLLEKTADHFERFIKQHVEVKGMGASRRFSPGYCDIPLEMQQSFCRFLMPASIGIVMTGSGAMRPEKTITAGLLFAKELSVLSPCGKCARAVCPHRRESQSSIIAGG